MKKHKKVHRPSYETKIEFDHHKHGKAEKFDASLENRNAKGKTVIYTSVEPYEEKHERKRVHKYHKEHKQYKVQKDAKKLVAKK